MALRLPSEIIVEKFLPTARSILVTKLKEKDFTQQEIADKLGITQATVSKYVSGKGNTERIFKNNVKMEKTMEKIAEGLASENMNEYEALAEILDLVHEFEDRGPICDVHEREMPSLKGLGCDICIRGQYTEIVEEQKILTNVRKSARKLSFMSEASNYIPNVGTNIGMSIKNPVDQTDIAAIPGRIYVTKGQINIPSNPEFGASEHVSRAILAANSVNNNIRAALNIKTDKSILKSAEKIGVSPVEFDPSYENRYKRIQKIFNEYGESSKIIYHKGDFGIEPITYLLEETSMNVVSLLSKLIEKAHN